jgi:hypothetical protein
MRTITLEFLRHGPAHNQLLSRLTNYLALCGNHGAQTVQMPFDHNQLLHRLNALEYRSDESSRQFQLEDTAQTLSAVLGQVAGLTAELSRRREIEDPVLHLRLVISASELALIPFELADAPHGFPGAGQSLLLQNQLPVCITREVRRAADADFEWPRRPKILFIAAQPPDVGLVPLEPHLLALRRVLEPWVNAPDDPEARRRQVAEFLTVLPNATVDQIQEVCAREAFTHVHILAHGKRYQEGEDYRFGLMLHGRDGSEMSDNVSGLRLAALLRAVQEPVGRKLACPAVVTLACCDSGNIGSVAGAGSSVAHALHGAGIPVVVASQFPLTFAGSILMVEILYEGLLGGLDPRSILNNLRRQLRAREPRSHDWASIVAYASLPPDFDQQLPDVQIEQASDAINRVLKEADGLVLELSEWWQSKRKSTSSDSPLVTPGKSADEYLPLYQQKITDANRMLQAVLEVEPARADVVYGLLATTKKREAQILYQLSRFGIDRIHYKSESSDALVQSLKHYTECLRVKPNSSWPLHQVLSLSLALGDKAYPHAEIWLQALSLGFATLRHGDVEHSPWAHTDLVELYLLATDTSRWNGGAQVQACLAQLHPQLGGAPVAPERARFHAGELIRIKGAESFTVETVVRQIVRYREWFTQLPGSLLGLIEGESETLLNILSP